MGLSIDRSTFSEDEYWHAAIRQRDNLRALKVLLDRPGFGLGEPSIGAEMEMSIVDNAAQALPLNREVLAESMDPNLQLELDRFNLEYNLSPVLAAGTPFAEMQKELTAALDALGTVAAKHDGRIVPIGILPTLRMEQLLESAMTDLPRYHALASAIRRIRQEQFHIRIDGEEPLDINCDALTIEGANTSFQLHLRVNPDEFATHYNAAQIATPLALAVGANSPFLLGHSLWDETRIALFKQSTDTRGSGKHEWRRAARVPFGHGWVRRGAYELFAESCFLYPILLPLCCDEDSLEIAKGGGTPKLAELRMQQGTIWNWNRAVYDSAAGGHLRIEMRALPSGPTPVDMMANAAFLLGLTVGLSRRVNSLLPAFPFRYAEYNFYRAAQFGLDAELLWPTLDTPSPRVATARALCKEFLTVADEGLSQLGVIDTERKSLLNIISDRLDSRTTPAQWQRRTLLRIGGKSRPQALSQLVEEYLSMIATGRPITEW